MKKSILLAFTASMMLGCTNHDVVYDPSIIQEEANKNFPVQNIDPIQDWNMIATCSLSVSVNQKSKEVYKVKVYSANPFDSESGAGLMASKENVADGSSVSLSFDAPKAIGYLYVVLEDSKYNRSLKSVEVSNLSASVSWGNDAVTAANKVTSRSGEQSRAITLPDNITFPTSIPDGAVDMNAATSVDKNHVYYLSDCDYSSKPITWNTDGITLYIKGKVIFNDFKIPNNYKVYILPEADVKVKSSIYIHTGASLYVGQDAKLEKALDNQTITL